MLSEILKRVDGYAPGRDVPLRGYGAAMATYAGLLGLVLFGVTRKPRRQPGAMDLALLGVGTHKLSRIITKDFVTSPLRAPFTSRREVEGAGEVHDEPRGNGWQRSIGELLTCPYCAGPWLATGLGALLTWRPAPTRFVLQTLAAVTVSDFLHAAYARLHESRKGVQAERQRSERGAGADAARPS